VTLKPRLRRLGRYGILSIASTLLGEACLALFVGAWQWPAALANLLAAFIVIGPLYVVSRCWVWPSRAPGGALSQALSFWLISLAAVVVSTISAGAAQTWARGLRLSHSTGTGVVLAAVLCSYGALWLVRFFVLDLLVFRRRSGPA